MSARDRRVRRARIASIVPLAVIVIVCALAASVSPRPERLALDLAWAAPSRARLFGSGEGGVDLFAVTAHAELNAILLATCVALSGFLFGTPLGAFAAMKRGAIERTVGRACDLLQAFPTFLLALTVLSAVQTPTRLYIGLVFALTAWVPFARLALAQTQVLRDAAFVEAARALGVGRVRVLVFHVLPNLYGVVAVQLGSSAAAVVVSEAALAFVGYGPKDGVSLGGVIDQGVAAMLRAPHVLVCGALAVAVTSAALMVAGRALAPAR